MVKTLFFLALNILFFFSTAQDLTGCWQSKLAGVNTYAELKLLKINDSVYTGISEERSIGGCSHYMSAKYNPKTKKFIGKDNKTIHASFLHTPNMFNLNYIIEDGIEYLEGRISAKDLWNIANFGISEKIKMRRINCDSMHIKTSLTVDNNTLNQFLPEETKDSLIAVSVYKPEWERYIDTIMVYKSDKKIEPNILEQNHLLTLTEEEKQIITEKKENRKNEVATIIRTNSKNIVLNIFDYGNEDGDRISIFLNDSIIANNIEITKKTKTISLKLDNIPKNKIYIIAENLGRIEPNTASIDIIVDDKTFSQKVLTDNLTNALIEIINAH